MLIGFTTKQPDCHVYRLDPPLELFNWSQGLCQINRTPLLCKNILFSKHLKIVDVILRNGYSIVLSYDSAGNTSVFPVLY